MCCWGIGLERILDFKFWIEIEIYLRSVSVGQIVNSKSKIQNRLKE